MQLGSLLTKKKKLLIFFFILFVGLFFFLTKDNQILRRYVLNDAKKTNYVPGEIIIGFSDDVPYTEAIQVIEKENLTYEKRDEDFEPSGFVLVPAGQTQNIQDELQKNKLVVETSPVSNMGTVQVKFVFGTTKTEAESVIKKEGLTMEKFFRFAFLKVKVPKGKEQYYIDKFQKIPIIKSAEVNPVIFLPKM